MLAGCAHPERALADYDRPGTWAKPLPRPGVPNLFEVAPGLFRGSQPTPAGIVELKRLGIKTIVNLRGWDNDEDQLAGQAIGYVSIHFHVWHPEDEDMVRFLKVANDPARQPVFVHCLRGIDRTGTMVAIYRTAVQGWSKDEAIAEMTQGGFGYDGQFPNLVRYLRELDIDRVRREAGLPALSR